MTTESLAGQPAVALALPQGDRVLVTLHGGQVVSWQSADEAGRLTERLYLSPRSVFDGSFPIRGGVPVCWPQFNRRGPLVKHGFVRNLPWQPVPTDVPDTLVLRLASSEASRAFWPESFEATLTVQLAPASLRIALDVRNTGDTPWSFTGALHTYLHVQDAAAVSLHGLQGAARWDAVRDTHSTEASPALRFGEEFDSVFAAQSAPLLLQDGARRLQISQSASCTETVVWNPGPALCAKLPDLPDDGWRHMLCVEAACIDTPQLVPPGAHWQAWQALHALA
ncbi:D-hexose-6-phosphate mutarotase [Xenophilus arseniciresistens]|uniref:Putative glucose-6-phosphate 1-epimerase n=1 Tax=Xenophilus arseniciresistens TaxID=1283306 RepID=A0AAE3N8Z8_9BURK|nr:D-hexose-6-phosphate mutarotase [Xenophilus arseniciresistens]MDA7415499.1 D-hexose-6-phosphate mutarotase [Xenophilus arseniciresistens]